VGIRLQQHRGVQEILYRYAGLKRLDLARDLPGGIRRLPLN
jgi:hypothetical protein